MSYHETGQSKVKTMKEVRAILYEYREEDLQVPYLLAECVDYLIDEHERLQEALKEIRSLNSVNTLILEIVENALKREEENK